MGVGEVYESSMWINLYCFLQWSSIYVESKPPLKFGKKITVFFCVFAHYSQKDSLFMSGKSVLLAMI